MLRTIAAVAIVAFASSANAGAADWLHSRALASLATPLDQSRTVYSCSYVASNGMQFTLRGREPVCAHQMYYNPYTHQAASSPYVDAPARPPAYPTPSTDYMRMLQQQEQQQQLQQQVDLIRHLQRQQRDASQDYTPCAPSMAALAMC